MSRLKSDEDSRPSGEAAGEHWVKPKGHLLPFCSHNNLKHPQMTGTQQHQEEVVNSS
jgi:uncharacterized radical SAM superfamily Fe-S cluster-containing enzyme